MKSFFIKCFSNFNQFNIIKNYKKNHVLDEFFLSHTINNKYIFNDTEINIYKNTIVGHSHQQFYTERSGFKLINPGSLGQDRMFINRGNFILYDSKTKIIELKNFTFNLDCLVNEMKAKKYPEQCIKYYLAKECI